MNGLAKRLLSSFMAVAMLFGMSTGWLTVPVFAASDGYHIDESFDEDPNWTIEEKMHYNSKFKKIEFLGNTGETGYLETPCINLVGAKDAELSFYCVSSGVSAKVYYKHGMETTLLKTIPQGTEDYITISLESLTELHGDAQIRISAEAKQDTAQMRISSFRLVPSFLVTLDPQEGEGGDDSVTAVYGSDMSAVKVPTRTNYTFVGYYTEANGGGVQYYDSLGNSTKKWDIAGAEAKGKTLYADWEVSPAQVTLIQGEGGGGTSVVTANYNEAMPTATMPQWTGHTFLGYFDSITGGTQYYTDEGKSARPWDKIGPTKLYAQWVGLEYYIIFDANGGSGGSSGTTAKYGDPLVKLDSFPARTGYSFAGYFLDNETSSTQYYDAAGMCTNSWDHDDPVTTLLAHWDANDYTIHFAPNDPGDTGGVTGDMADANAKYDTECPLPANEFACDGWTFVGWMTKADGDKTDYKNKANVLNLTAEKDGEVTLYARWLKNRTIDDKTYIPWTDTENLPDTAGNYYLVDDVHLTETWTAPDGVELDLNGNDIVLTGDAGAVINVPDGNTLKICDKPEGDERGTITGGKDGGVIVNGTLDMTGGVVTGNTGNTTGGVTVGENGSFTVSDDAAVTGNTANGKPSNITGPVNVSGVNVVGVNGSVAVDENGNLIVSGQTQIGEFVVPEGTTVKIPADKLDQLAASATDLTLPEGTKVWQGDSPAIELVDGGKLLANGTVQVTDDADHTVTISGGGTVDVTDDGIVVTDGDNSVTVKGDADVTVSDNGITVSDKSGNSTTVTGDATVNTTGDNGIVVSDGDNSVTVKGDADVDTTGDDGITVSDDNDNSVTVKGDADVTVGGDGITVSDGDNSVTVKGDANVDTTGDDGITVSDDNDNSVTVKGNADVTVSDDGIVVSDGQNTVTVTGDADVDTTGDGGITVSDDNGNTVTVTGEKEVNVTETGMEVKDENGKTSTISGGGSGEYTEDGFRVVDGNNAVTVTGDASISVGENGITVSDGEGNSVTVTGDAKVDTTPDGYIKVSDGKGNSVTVTGDKLVAITDDGIKVNNADGSGGATFTGDATQNADGSYDLNNGGAVKLVGADSAITVATGDSIHVPADGQTARYKEADDDVIFYSVCDNKLASVEVAHDAVITDANDAPVALDDVLTISVATLAGTDGLTDGQKAKLASHAGTNLLFEIRPFINGTGAAHLNCDKNITVRIPFTGGSLDGYSLFYLKDDGTEEQITPISLKTGCLEYGTNHLSIWLLNKPASGGGGGGGGGGAGGGGGGGAGGGGGGGGVGGGGGAVLASSSTGSVTITGDENGTVTVNPSSPNANDTVTVTVKPNDGYMTMGITVTDANGNPVAVADNGNGTYTYTQPGGGAKIRARIYKQHMFYDVPQGSYYEEPVAWAVTAGVTNGTSLYTFDPGGVCTRAQAITFLWRALGSPKTTNTNAMFTDVTNPDAYYYKAILWGVENGVTYGYTDGSFGVEDTVNRAQMITMMARALKGKPQGSDNFDDVPAGTYFTEAAAWAKEQGVVKGLGNNQFGGEQYCYRAEIVTMLFRYFCK